MVGPLRSSTRPLKLDFEGPDRSMPDPHCSDRPHDRPAPLSAPRRQEQGPLATRQRDRYSHGESKPDGPDHTSPPRVPGPSDVSDGLEKKNAQRTMGGVKPMPS